MSDDFDPYQVYVVTAAQAAETQREIDEYAQRVREVIDAQSRCLIAGAQLWEAIDQADAALIPDEVKKAADDFRAVIEENAP